MSRVCWIVALLMLAPGCATTRVVNLDTGQGAPIVYTPIESAPLEISEEEYKNAVTQLVLDMELKVALNEFERGDSRLFLASAGGIADSAQGRAVPSLYKQICQPQGAPGSCSSLLTGGFTLELMERRRMALYFALDTVWDGVEEAIKDFTNPAALRATITTMIGTALVMLVAPEPMTRLIAITLTASLIAYLGTGPVWHMGQAFLRLLDESRNAKNISELEDAGHLFGKRLGDNGARVLVVVALAALGGKNAMAAQGPKLPSAAQVALRAQAEGGFQLSAAYAGEVQAIAVPAPGVLNVTLAPTAVAAVAMGPGNGVQGDPEGSVHHIYTNKNEISEASGGPWTPQFEKFFRLANMDFDDPANLIRIKGHKGPHPREYHQEVLDRITKGMKRCKGPAQCRVALVGELAKIARDLMTEGTRLRHFVTRITEE